MQATIKLKDGEYIGIDNLQLIRQHESLQQYLPLAVLKLNCIFERSLNFNVATVLTACGIETDKNGVHRCEQFAQLQQYLPLAVLKRDILQIHGVYLSEWLQQYLPLAVLKQQRY